MSHKYLFSPDRLISGWSLPFLRLYCGYYIHMAYRSCEKIYGLSAWLPWFYSLLQAFVHNLSCVSLRSSLFSLCCSFKALFTVRTSPYVAVRSVNGTLVLLCLSMIMCVAPIYNRIRDLSQIRHCVFQWNCEKITDKVTITLLSNSKSYMIC